MTHSQGRAEWIPTADGRRLYAQVIEGPPDASATVVFEAGAAASRSTWALVQPLVAAFARAVVYDRSGLGRSAPDPAGRTLRRMADDLVDVVARFDDRPVVLVGHSAGGPIVRLAASADPSRIAGIVLVDPSDEASEVLFGRAFRLGERVTVSVGVALAKLGLLHRLHGPMLAAMPSSETRNDLEREGFTPQAIRTAGVQSRTFLDELAAWRRDPPEIDDVAVTVVSGTRPGEGMSRSVRRDAITAHALRVRASSRGRHVLAEFSGHSVPITDHELVAAEVRRLVVVAGDDGEGDDRR